MSDYHDKLAKLENLRELGAHGILEMLGLDLCHVPRREIKHFFGEKLQDGHVVLTKTFVRLASTDNVWNERWPVFWPFSFQN